MAYMGASASGKACTCEVKDKANWKIVGKVGKKTIVYCRKCQYQWDTTAKYVEELKRNQTK